MKQSTAFQALVTRITAEPFALAYRIDGQVTPMAGSSVVDSSVLGSSPIEDSLRPLAPEQLRAVLANFLPKGATSAEQARAIEARLRSPAGQSMRDTMARWIVDSIVPVERLVPKAYVKWRPPVRDAMMFVVAHLSPARLAPKLVEQLDLPLTTSAEARLLRLIAKVPGLQKLGQVIARNQHLRPALRNALARLENGIRDVRPGRCRCDHSPRVGASGREIWREDRAGHTLGSKRQCGGALHLARPAERKA